MTKNKSLSENTEKVDEKVEKSDEIVEENKNYVGKFFRGEQEINVTDEEMKS